MIRETVYLSWANRWFPQVRYNLAKAGMSGVDAHRLPVPRDLHASNGWADLRAQVARFHGVQADQSFPCLGATQALWLACAALIEQGDEVLIEAPAYEAFWRIPEALGAKVRHVQRGAGQDLQTWAQALQGGAKLVVISNPHNPSGATYHRETLQTLAAMCDAVGAYLLVDEIFAPFAQPLASDGTWQNSAADLGRNIVAVSSLSKAFGLGGLRAGWVLATPEVIERCSFAAQSVFGDPSPAQSAVALSAFAHLLEIEAQRTRDRADERCALVARWIEAHPQLSWTQPEATPFGFVELPSSLGLRECIERGAAEHEVLVVPGEFFGHPCGFRLGWALPNADLLVALDRLERVLSPWLECVELPGRRSGYDTSTPLGLDV